MCNYMGWICHFSYGLALFLQFLVHWETFLLQHFGLLSTRLVCNGPKKSLPQDLFSLRLRYNLKTSFSSIGFIILKTVNFDSVNCDGLTVWN